MLTLCALQIIKKLLYVELDTIVVVNCEAIGTFVISNRHAVTDNVKFINVTFYLLSGDSKEPILSNN